MLCHLRCWTGVTFGEYKMRESNVNGVNTVNDRNFMENRGRWRPTASWQASC